MNGLVKYGLIAAVIGGVYLFGMINDGSDNSDTSYTDNDIDLNAVLDITVDTIYAYEENLSGQDEYKTTDILADASPEAAEAESAKSDAAFIGFAETLADNYNAKQPALHTSAIGVAAQTDASVLAFEDLNANKNQDAGEESLFLVEIDGENSRVIASSRSGAVNDHHFSGTGLLTGYLLGSMLSRQRAAGVSPGSLSSKKPVTARAAAKSRAGSGSHSRGK
ncbi:MAG: hypothetical protein ACI93R_002234 [Flavobacteriales bacterium]|jgi:hypothetical protein